jgi:hypothetical protein
MRKSSMVETQLVRSDDKTLAVEGARATGFVTDLFFSATLRFYAEFGFETDTLFRPMGSILMA